MIKTPFVQKMKHCLSIPFIYGVILPVIFLDIILELYHRTCFPLYGIPYVQRSKYIKIDRHKLSYLNIIEKFNCTYCGYMNGFAGYFVAIGKETEKYWCAIKHETDPKFNSPDYHKDFRDYDKTPDNDEHNIRLKK